MKILLANYKSFPRLSGTASYIVHLRDQLVQLGHEVDILAHKPGMDEIYIANRTIRKQPLKEHADFLLRPFYRERYPHFTKWMVQREIECYTFRSASVHLGVSGYDIIHTQDIISTRALSSVVKGMIPIVATFHNCKTKEWYTSGEANRKSALERRYIAQEELVSANSADHLILPCQWLKQELETWGELTTPHSVFPYGMNIEQFYAQLGNAAATKKAQKQPPVIACPARLVPVKGHAYLLSALKMLKERNRSFVCWIIGEGILAEELRQQASSLKLDDYVKFLGGRDDVPALLGQAAIVVLPSIHDTLPFSVMEGQLAGKPVVAASVGGVPEMIEDGVSGLLFTPKDSTSLADQLERLLTSMPLREEMGQAAKAWAQSVWALDRMIEKTLQAYQQAQNESQSKDPGSVRLMPDIDMLKSLSSRTVALDLDEGIEASLAGTVINEQQTPVYGASVHLVDHSNILLSSTQTSADGGFYIEKVPIGKYSIIVWKEGASQPLSMSIDLSRVSRLQLQLMFN